MVSFTTPIPPMRAAWTASGVCTSGSTALPRGAMRRASGGAATTNTTSAERNHGSRSATAGVDLTTRSFRAIFPARLLWRLRVAPRRQRGGDDPLVHVHGEGRDAD